MEIVRFGILKVRPIKVEGEEVGVGPDGDIIRVGSIETVGKGRLRLGGDVAVEKESHVGVTVAFEVNGNIVKEYTDGYGLHVTATVGDIYEHEGKFFALTPVKSLPEDMMFLDPDIEVVTAIPT